MTFSKTQVFVAIIGIVLLVRLSAGALVPEIVGAVVPEVVKTVVPQVVASATPAIPHRP